MNIPVEILRAKRVRQLVFAANIVAHAVVKQYDQEVLDARIDQLVEAWIAAGV